MSSYGQVLGLWCFKNNYVWLRVKNLLNNVGDELLVTIS